MTIAVYGRNTLAGAKRIVFDEGINIAPSYKSKRERLIELAAQWNDRHLPVDKKKAVAVRKAKVRRKRHVPILPAVEMEEGAAEATRILNRNGMPGWARDIVIRVAKVHGVSPLDVATSCRKRDVIPARNEVYYLLRTMVSPVTGNELSYPMIAKWFGRDHTGVLWGAARHARDNDLPPVGSFDVEKAGEIKRKRHQAKRWLR